MSIIQTALLPQQPTSQVTSSKSYFANLDFLRVVAFSMVFALHTHLAEILGLLSTNKFYHRFLQLASDGVLGVSFFFVLSGFLITYLLLTEVVQTGHIALFSFYIRRTLRIWPLYLVVVLFGSIVYPNLKNLSGFSHDFSNRVLYYLSFLSNFDYIYLLHHGLEFKSILILAVTWSVSIEEQFYLVWPILFIIIPKKYYKCIFYGVIIFSLSFRYLHRVDAPVLTYHTFSVASDLAIGGLAAWYSRNSINFLQFIQQLSRNLIATIYTVGLLFLLFRDVFYPVAILSILDRLVCSIFFAFILLEQNFGSNSPIKFSRFRHISSLGKYTYGLYLLHPIAIQVATFLLRVFYQPKQNIVGGLLHAALSLAIVLPTAYISYQYFELPFIKLKHKFTAGNIAIHNQPK